MNSVIEKVMKQLYEKTGSKHDAYYTEGQGVKFVVEGQPEANVVFSLNEDVLQMMLHTGQEININVK